MFGVRNENNSAICIQKKTIKFGGGNIMVWGAMSWHGVGPLVRINGRMDKFQYKDILENHMEPYTFSHMPINHTFMHDNDPKHSSKLVKEWLSVNQINVLDWPPQSPDLNPIENLWYDVELAIKGQTFPNFDSLWLAVQRAWQNIPIHRCQRLIESMPRRCSAVLSAKGYPTKY